MKAVTVAKIARMMIIFIVLVVLAVPTFGGIESMRLNGGEFVATEARYQLDCMTADDLANNMINASVTDGGYTVSYGDVVGREVPTYDADIESLAEDIMTQTGGEGTATLLGPDGKIVKQKMITGLKDYTQYVFTGLRLTGSMVNSVNPSISLVSDLNGVINRISDVEVTKTKDSFLIKLEIPFILVAPAMAGEDARINLNIGIDYMEFFSMEVTVGMPASDLVGEDHSFEFHVNSGGEYGGSNGEYAGTELIQTIDINLDMGNIPETGMTIGGFGGSDGGIRIEVDSSGNVKIMSDKEGIVDALEGSRNPDGTLTVRLDGEEPYVVSKKNVDSLMSMVSVLVESGVI